MNLVELRKVPYALLMRKLQILTLSSLLILGFFTSPAPTQAETIATPKPGAACTDAGYFGIANGQMMTCVQSGSSLKWRLEKNVIADGSCVWWTNGDESTWEELQLFLGGKWVTQALPIAFTSGPFCDTTKSNSAIPWIALPSKIADGTKYRWIKGRSGKDGQGGREFAKGYADPVFTYTQAAMKRKNLKIYTAIVAPVYGPHAYALQKAKESAATTTPTPVATPALAQSATPTPAPAPSMSASPASYTAKDQTKLRHLVAQEGCANPSNATVVIQAQVGSEWVPVKSINSGWLNSPAACPVAQLGKKDSLAWVDIYLDPGVTYRWYFTGEVNIRQHDGHGGGFSESAAIALPRPVITPHPVVGTSGITWENITTRVKDISAAAYVDAKATIARNQGKPNAGENFITYVSPGAAALDPKVYNSIELMKETFVLHANFPHPKKVFFIASTMDEKDATYAKIDSLYPTDTFMKSSFDNMYGIKPNEPAGSVFTHTKCEGQDSGRNTVTWSKIGDASAVLWSYCPGANEQASIESNHGAAHEYAHTLQIEIYRTGNLRSVQPCWMTEGEVEWTQIAVSPNFDEYIKMQHLHPYYLTDTGLNYSVPTQTTWTAAELQTYLEGANQISTCGKTPVYALAYSAGTAAVEALVSIGGSESFFAVDQRMADGSSFEQAFKDVYGVTWAYAEPILAEVVAQKLTHVNQPDASTYQTRPAN